MQLLLTNFQHGLPSKNILVYNSSRRNRLFVISLKIHSTNQFSISQSAIVMGRKGSVTCELTCDTPLEKNSNSKTGFLLFRSASSVNFQTFRQKKDESPACQHTGPTHPLSTTASDCHDFTFII